MARNIYQEITDKIVSALEAGDNGKWEQSWANLAKGTLPRNVASGRAYRGVNVLSLWASDYASGWWGTYQQWQAIGAQVRKGEKSSQVVFFKPVQKKRAADANGATGADAPETKDDSFLMLKYYNVFNLEQVDALPNEDGTPGTIKLPGLSAAPSTEAERIASAEAFFAGIGGKVNHGGDRAYFNPNSDYIQMPQFAQFNEPGAYYSTLAHEYIHWTGHKSRLDRTFGQRFGDEAYAVEELVAELGAAFTMGMLELSPEPRKDHAQYLASWLKVLKQDPKAIFTVANRAQAGAEYLAGRAGLQAEEELPAAA